MAIQRLVIEYVSDKPICPPDHFKMETGKYCGLAWDCLKDTLILFSREGIITPIEPEPPREHHNRD